MLNFHHHIAQSRAGRNLNLFHIQLAGLVGLRRHLFVSRQTRLALGLTALSTGAHPFELFLDALGSLSVLLAFDLHALSLGLKVRRVVAFVGVGPATVELKNPLRNVVEEVPVVGYRDHGSWVLLEVLLQPQHGLSIQVVGRFVEQQKVRGLQKQATQRDASTLTTREHRDVSIAWRATQCIHGLLNLRVKVPGVAVIELFLQRTHLGEKGVEVRIGFTELGGNVVELVQHGDGFGHAIFHVF
ncbi:unannotated protein [freshwater metagenome]|uniref:Unannotated protein n=1 Tax=freshwater metagenome TaxID=449393 RepID=A0A6J6C6F9_9ZZZZ